MTLGGRARRRPDALPTPRADSGALHAAAATVLAAAYGDALTLREFLADDAAALDELSDELEMQLADLEGLQHDAEQLASMRKTLQDEALSSVLFVLTAATVFCLPFQLLSSYFGMNFDDMVELDTAAGGWGVKTFWLFGAGFTILVAAVFVRLRLYRFVAF